MDAEEVRHLSSLTNMETLRFDCTLHSDTCLTPFLGDLSALVTLQIPESEAVTTELLDRMAQLSALQDLDLTCYHVSRHHSAISQEFSITLLLTAKEP